MFNIMEKYTQTLHSSLYHKEILLRYSTTHYEPHWASTVKYWSCWCVMTCSLGMMQNNSVNVQCCCKGQDSTKQVYEAVVCISCDKVSVNVITYPIFTWTAALTFIFSTWLTIYFHMNCCPNIYIQFMYIWISNVSKKFMANETLVKFWDKYLYYCTALVELY